MNPHDPRLELIQRYADGHASGDETLELQSALSKDPELRRVYLDYVHLDSALAAIAADRVVAREGAEISFPATRAPEPGLAEMGSRSASARWFPLAAAIIVLGAILAIWSRHPSAGVSIEVMQAAGGRLAASSSELRPGQRLALRLLRLEAGSITLRLPSGVQLSMSAPIEAELETPMRVRLRQGRLSADVGEKGVGFTIVTEAGEVVDLGTSFGMEVDRDGESRVAVFSGQVKVRAGGAAEGRAFTTLNEGEAVRFSAIAGLRRWQHVALAAEAAGLVSGSSTAVVAAVRDNLSEDELHPFYGVVREGMRPGSLAFTDKPNPRWAPGPNDPLPAWLDGADLIRTYHQFRHRKDYELVLTLREPATVFVLVDPRQPEPSWLTDRFVPTGARVMVGPWQQAMKVESGTEVRDDDLPYLPFAIWRAEAPAGEFRMGAPRDIDRRNTALMYGVAVKASSAVPTLSHP